MFKKIKRSVRLSFRRIRTVQRLWACFRWYRLWRTIPVLNWIRAAEYFKVGDFRNAARCYRVGLSAHPRHKAVSSAQVDLAYCLYRLDQPEEALEIVNRSIEEGSLLKDAYLLSARIHLIFGQALSALSALEKFLVKEPEDVQALTCFMYAGLVGNVSMERLEETRRRLLALKCRFLLEDERNIHIDTALAHYEIRLGDSRYGERLLARVLATGTAPFEAVLLRGERLLVQGRLLQAREQLARAMKAVPRDPRPALLLAKSYINSSEAHNKGWALQLAQVACRLSCWQNAECLRVLAQVYQSSNKKAEAQLFLERMKNLRSMLELNIIRVETAIDQPKVSNT